MKPQQWQRETVAHGREFHDSTWRSVGSCLISSTADTMRKATSLKMDIDRNLNATFQSIFG
jgi:hypothetical protein